MKWSEEAWTAIESIYANVLDLAFIKELTDGRLPKEKFIFYIRQDALYLSEYGKVLAGIASRVSCPEHMKAFLSFAGESVSVEKALHESFLAGADKSASVEASPSCLLYTSYLHRQMGSAPVEVILASVLPCFWIYKKVGDYILENQVKQGNPYQEWINTYGGEEFEDSVNLAISICDEYAAKCTPEQRDAMTRSFVMCSKMEWLFWDSAYREEQWNV